MRILGGLSVFVILAFVAIGFYLKNNADTNEQIAQNQVSSPLSAKTIQITGLAFVPNEVKISKGATVLWTNNDRVNHRVI